MLSIGLCTSLSSQLLGQKSLQATKIQEAIKIDGILDEESWNTAAQASDFINVRPIPAKNPSNPTIVKLLYDNDAIYIAANIYETSKDSIMMELTERDQIANTDYFGIILDTYGNGTSAFEFIAMSTGVQFDAIITRFNEDSNWDAVWENAVSSSDDGWIVEFKIPYSAIRFPNKEIQTWKIQFFTKRSRNGEQSVWNYFDPNENNPWLQKTGILQNVKNIKAPLRLSFSPYLSLYGLHSKDLSKEQIKSFGSSYNLGLDLKYGINDAFTLDMTLIPDFGQVQSDDQILNLSPFEVQYQEKRPFFTEGLELFNKGGLFYSRRVGNDQQLYNATKISGRSSSGLGLGFFNAVAAPEKETINTPELEEKEIINKPLTNYNIVVFDKDLKNNSSLSFTNSNVYRKGVDFYDANVSAINFQLNNKKQTYRLSGNASASNLMHHDAKNILGHKYYLGLNKTSGKFVAGINIQETSENYNANDLGYSIYENSRGVNLFGEYRNNEGNKKLNAFNSWFNVNYSARVVPQVFTRINFNVGFWAQTKKFNNFNMWTNYVPKSLDYYEPRTHNRFYTLPAYNSFGYSYRSDSRKKLLVNIYGNIFNYNNDNRLRISKGTFLRYRFSNKFNCYLDLYYSNEKNAKGYVNHDGADIIFGNRLQKSFSNVLGSNYTFNDKMSIDFRLRHYWSGVQYDEFFSLNEIGSLDKSTYQEFHDFNYSNFAIDLTYRWIFAPGSEINIVWKNNIAGSLNDPIALMNQTSYHQDFSQLRMYPQSNSLSIRFMYYIDSNNAVQKLFRK